MDECEVSCGQLGQYERAQVRVFCAVRLAQDARWFVEDQEVVILVCQTGFKFAALDTTEPDVSGPRLRRGFSPRSRSHKISERISLTSVGARTSALRTPRAARMISALALWRHSKTLHSVIPLHLTSDHATHLGGLPEPEREISGRAKNTAPCMLDVAAQMHVSLYVSARVVPKKCRRPAVAAPSVALALPRVAVGSGVETSVETVASPAC